MGSRARLAQGPAESKPQSGEGQMSPRGTDGAAGRRRALPTRPPGHTAWPVIRAPVISRLKPVGTAIRSLATKSTLAPRRPTDTGRGRGVRAGMGSPRLPSLPRPLLPPPHVGRGVPPPVQGLLHPARVSHGTRAALSPLAPSGIQSGWGSTCPPRGQSQSGTEGSFGLLPN